MRLYEFEGKKLFRLVGIPLVKGIVVDSIEEAIVASSNLGYPVVVKAQVLRGGRGKEGLVKLMTDHKEAEQIISEIKGKIEPEEKLLIEEIFIADIEAYMGITIDDLSGLPIMIISSAGGVDIEESTEKGDGQIARFPIDISIGIYPHQMLARIKDIGFSGKIAVTLASIAIRLYDIFTQFDCDTVEINPIMINSVTGEVVAGDSKIIIDEYSYYRQPEILKIRESRPIKEAKNIFYVDLGGDIAIVSGGASGTMMLCDSIKIMGGEPGNFLDGTGGNSPESVRDKSLLVLEMVKENPRFTALFFNFNLSASSLKNIVEGVCQAVDTVSPCVPVVASVRATGAALNHMSLSEASEIFKSKGIELSGSLLEAIKRVIYISKNNKRRLE